MDSKIRIKSKDRCAKRQKTTMIRRFILVLIPLSFLQGKRLDGMESAE